MITSQLNGSEAEGPKQTRIDIRFGPSASLRCSCDVITVKVNSDLAFDSSKLKIVNCVQQTIAFFNKEIPDLLTLRSVCLFSQINRSI